MLQELKPVQITAHVMPILDDERSFTWRELETNHGTFLIRERVMAEKPFQECVEMTIDPGNENEEKVWAIQVWKA